MILKKHFDLYRSKGGLPPELKELEGQVKLFDNAELLKVWRTNLKGIRWTDEEGNLLRGAVDDLLQKGSKLIVLDYKTRGFPLKEDTAGFYKDQLSIYNFLLRKNGHETEDYAYLLFFYPERVTENGDVAFHAKLVKIDVSVENAEQIFRNALDVLGKDMPAAGEECKYCKWIESCSKCL